MTIQTGKRGELIRGDSRDDPVESSPVPFVYFSKTQFKVLTEALKISPTIHLGEEAFFCFVLCFLELFSRGCVPNLFQVKVQGRSIAALSVLNEER